MKRRPNSVGGSIFIFIDLEIRRAAQRVDAGEILTLKEKAMREVQSQDDVIELGAVSAETKGGIETEVEDRDPLF